MKVEIACGPGRLWQIFLLLAAFTVGCAQSNSPAKNGQEGQYASIAGVATDRTPAPQAILPPQSLPADFEELWIVQKPGPQVIRDRNTELAAGSGLLLARTGPNLLVCPLQRTEFDARVTGAIATVNVRQNFTNPSQHIADLIYAFSLPQGAGVSDFVMTIGTRHIRGIIRERAEAEQIYKEARDQGFSASLLSQVSPNLFAQSLANVAPSKSIDIAIQYFQAVPYVDGWFTLSFPLVTGPRQWSLPQPTFRKGSDVTVNVQLDCGMPIDRIESPTHTIKVDRRDSGGATVTLDAGDTIANQDMEIRYKPAGSGLRSSLVTQVDAAGGFCALTVLPPDDWHNLPRRPVELLVLTSISEVAAINDVRASASAALAALAPGDSYRVVDLRSDADQMLRLASPQQATPDNVRRSIGSLEPRVNGRAALLDRLKSMLADKPDPLRGRLICLLTDGRDNAPWLLWALISAPRGSVVIGNVGPHADGAAINVLAAAVGAAVIPNPADVGTGPLLSNVIDRFAHPCLTDVQIDWNGAAIRQPLFASSQRDLIAGRPLTLMARFDGKPPKVTVRGNASSGQVVLAVNVTSNLPDTGILARMYARLQLADLVVRRGGGGAAQIDQEIRRICLENGLLSRFTSFICVDAREKVIDPTPPAPQTMHGGSI